MIRIKCIMLSACVLFAFCKKAFSQEHIDTVNVTLRKTTSIVFSYPIVNVDRGSSDVIAQKVKGANNTLQLKASRGYFPETNVTVITDDGRLHHFYIHYDDSPSTQILFIDKNGNHVQFEDRKTALQFETAIDQIFNDRSSGSIRKKSKFKVQLVAKAIYVQEDVIYLKIHISNHSNISYDIESIRFFVRDKKKVKRTAAQEIEINPLYTSTDVSFITGNETVTKVYALQKFTIADAKTFDIELCEKSGGRNLKLRLTNHAIIQARRLPK